MSIRPAMRKAMRRNSVGNRPGDKRALSKGAASLGAALFWVAFWALLASRIGQPLLLPDPLAVAVSLARLMVTGGFWRDVADSVLRAGGAFAIGVALGTVLAVGTTQLALLRALLRPALVAIRATPVSSFIILALVWLKADWVPVLVGALMVLPIVWGNVSQGIESVDPELLEMARMYGFSSRQRVLKLYVPSVQPTFLAACETAMGLCWKATIAAEVLGLPRGAIGTRLHDAKIYLETDALFAWTLAVILLSLLLERAFAWLVRRAALRSDLRERGEANALRA